VVKYSETTYEPGDKVVLI